MVTGAVNYYVRNGEAYPTTGANCGDLVSHDLAVSKASVANVLMTVSVTRRLPGTNGRSQLTQFIAVRNTFTPAGLPSGANGPSKCTEVVPKR